MKASPLLPFVKGLRQPPYVVDGTPVTAAVPRAGVTFGHARKRNELHRIASLAVAWTADGPQAGARWLCEIGSTHARLVSDASLADDPYTCTGCEQIFESGGITGPCVYRVYTTGRRRLLYIGATKNWPRRRRQHRSNTWWWMDLARAVDLQGFPTIEEALAAEAQAIRAERPEMNRTHNLRAAS